MSFCRLSNTNFENAFTVISNKFITDYCLAADDLQIKVYLYGLYLCAMPISANNTQEAIAIALSCSEEEVEKAMRYWERTGAISIVSNEPLEVVYNPLVDNEFVAKKYKKDEFSDFNVQVQSIFDSRIVSPNEFLKYYELLEDTSLSQEALLMIMSYCVSIKGKNIKYPYITAVAKDWVRSGVRTIEEIEAKMQEYDSITDNLKILAVELGKKGYIDLSDKQLYVKWTNTWGYDFESILYVARQCNKRGGMARLDRMLDEYFRFGCLSLANIKVYATEKERLFEITKSIVKSLGLRYEDLTNIVESYTQVWINKGFEDEALKSIAQFCFRKSIRTIDGMNTLVDSFEKQGCFTVDAINEHIIMLAKRDKEISEIIIATGSHRSVTNSDRDSYLRWTSWGFSKDIIIYAAHLAEGRPYAFGFMNGVLSKWKEANVTTLEQAKNIPSDKKSEIRNSNSEIIQKEYTKEELDALIDDLKILEE